MVHRHPHHRQADRDVHAVVAIDRLEGRVALVVIAGDHEFPLPRTACGNSASAGIGPAARMPAALARPPPAPGCRHPAAENAVLARVRVQAGHGHRLVATAQRLAKAPARRSTARMRAGFTSSMAWRSDTWVVAWNTYRSPADSTSEKVLTPNSCASSSVWPPLVAGGVHRGLVQRRAVTMASTRRRARQRARGGDEAHRAVAGLGADLAQLDVRQRRAGLHHLDSAGRVGRVGRTSHRAHDGRIAAQARTALAITAASPTTTSRALARRARGPSASWR